MNRRGSKQASKPLRAVGGNPPLVAPEFVWSEACQRRTVLSSWENGACRMHPKRGNG